jgi:large subunit ribosomal protein L10
MAAKTRKINQRKQDAVVKIKELFSAAQDTIFTDFSGLSVEQITELRRKLKAQNNDYKVIKNNYTRLAMSELGLPDMNDCLIGPTAVAFVEKDAGPAAKAILDFAMGSTVRVKGAVVGGKTFTVEDVRVLSKLPGKEQLLAQLMSTMNAPIRNLAYVLNGVAGKLVQTIKAVGDKMSENK